MAYYENGLPTNKSSNLNQHHLPNHHINQFSFDGSSINSYIETQTLQFVNVPSFSTLNTSYSHHQINDSGTNIMYNTQKTQKFDIRFHNLNQTNCMMDFQNSEVRHSNLKLDGQSKGYDRRCDAYNQRNFQNLDIENNSVYKPPRSTNFLCRNEEDEYRKNTYMDQSKKTRKVIKTENMVIIKGQWSEDEDILLKHLVDTYGAKSWAKIASKMKGRVGKQCRERWHNHLKPEIMNKQWTEEEDLILIQQHQLVGNSWAKISHYLPGRTENGIKNHWNAAKRRKWSTSTEGKKSRPDILQDYIRKNIVMGVERSFPRPTSSTNMFRPFSTHQQTHRPPPTDYIPLVPTMLSQPSGCSNMYEHVTNVSMTTNGPRNGSSFGQSFVSNEDVKPMDDAFEEFIDDEMGNWVMKNNGYGH